MAGAVNAGARLDRLPVSSFHYRIFWLVGAGMFFDGYDLYVAGGVLAATVQTKFSTVPQNLQFLSLTFVGMTIGSLITGFLGDKFGRRFTYQVNLLIFGLASFAAAFAQDMNQLIACRFVQGLGLGAEIVVGYSTLTEFVPPRTRGRWLAFMAFLTVCGFPVTSILSYLIIPDLGLAADVHHRRRGLADRLVSAQEPAGIAALARSARPRRRGRGADDVDRAGGGGEGGPAAAGGGAGARAASGVGGAGAAAAAGAHGGRLLGADHHQHADFRLRDFPAAVLPAPGADHRQFARLHRGAGGRLAGRLRARRLSGGLRRAGAGASSARRSRPSCSAGSTRASTRRPMRPWC